MKKYIVTGYTKVTVEVVVEAKNKEDAIEKAYEECSGPMSFVGNGGYDKLIGVCNTDNADVSIVCDDEVEYTEVEEIE